MEITIKNNKLYICNKEIKYQTIGDTYYLSLNNILSNFYYINGLSFYKLLNIQGNELIDLYVGKKFKPRYICSLEMNKSIKYRIDTYFGDDIFISTKNNHFTDTINIIFNKLGLNSIEPITFKFIN